MALVVGDKPLQMTAYKDSAKEWGKRYSYPHGDILGRWSDGAGLPLFSFGQSSAQPCQAVCECHDSTVDDISGGLPALTFLGDIFS